jgi:predicted phosphoribosyltransferase
MTRRFHDRHDAGRVLAGRLTGYAGRDDVIVLALPRGGVPVGYEVARALGAPLDVFVVRKLGVPGHPELAFGAIASGGIRVLNTDVIRSLAIAPALVEHVAVVERAELERRERAYRGGSPSPDIIGRTVILVDDGLATGATMRAAVRSALKAEPARLVVAVPVGPAHTCRELLREVDEVVCPYQPEPFWAVGLFYRDFAPTEDSEVEVILREAYDRQSAKRAA